MSLHLQPLLLDPFFSSLCVCVRAHSPCLQSEQLTLRGHTNLVDQVQWHPTRKDIVATISRDETLKIWDARSASAGKGGGSVHESPFATLSS